MKIQEKMSNPFRFDVNEIYRRENARIGRRYTRGILKTIVRNLRTLKKVYLYAYYWNVTNVPKYKKAN